ncbi:hypothetical protein DOLIC_00025 [Dolichomitus sp. PSUC_FEM 10030005]|nr:hypothetical protein [Dolichomitus sp. PSUC_FEM 10030005]
MRGSKKHSNKRDGGSDVKHPFIDPTHELLIEMSGEGPIDTPSYKRLSHVLESIISAIDPNNSDRLIDESVESISVSSSLHLRDWTRLFAYSNSQLLEHILANLDNICHEYFHRSLAHIPQQTIIFHSSPELAQMTELMSELHIYPYFHGAYLCLFINSVLIGHLLRGVGAIDFLTSENNINCHTGAAGSDRSGDIAIVRRGEGSTFGNEKFTNYQDKKYALGVKLEQLVKTGMTDGYVQQPQSTQSVPPPTPINWLEGRGSGIMTGRDTINDAFLLEQLGVNINDEETQNHSNRQLTFDSNA